MRLAWARVAHGELSFVLLTYVFAARGIADTLLARTAMRSCFRGSNRALEVGKRLVRGGYCRLQMPLEGGGGHLQKENGEAGGLGGCLFFFWRQKTTDQFTLSTQEAPAHPTRLSLIPLHGERLWTVRTGSGAHLLQGTPIHPAVLVGGMSTRLPPGQTQSCLSHSSVRISSPLDCNKQRDPRLRCVKPLADALALIIPLPNCTLVLREKTGQGGVLPTRAARSATSTSPVTAARGASASV